MTNIETTTLPDDISYGGKTKKEFFDELTKIAAQQLLASEAFKKPLLEKWKSYEELKAGKVKKKLRTPFQVAFPIFSGMLDTLAASFDEPIELEFYPTKPADFFKSKKVQGAWNTEKSKTDVTSRWDYKSRIEKNLALIYGRGIATNFAESSPTYRSVLEIIDPLYFHCQPEGGGLLENHLFCGREDIFKSEAEITELAASKIYDEDQWKQLKEKQSGDSTVLSNASDNLQSKLTRFKALGLNPESNGYVGEKIFNLVEWCMQYKNKRYYLVFDPFSLTWLRGEKLRDVYSLDLYPYTSWATHEDAKVFWSKSYADDLYPISDAITTLFNQELTNREKRNMGARAYDKDMFPDVAKLDAAQYRPDALVPVDTKGGTRKIQDGIYYFQTAELEGTINLLDWVQKSTAKDTGISDIAQGSAMQATKKVNVAYMEQASIAKRIGYKSQSFSECWGERGVRYFQGLRDHMTPKMAIQTIGDLGLEWDEITREDLDLEGDIGVRVISSTARKEEMVQKKAGRIEALKLMATDPTLVQALNPQWKASAILRDVGNYDDDEIKLALDTKNSASRESVAHAHVAIQKIISGMKPDINFEADSVFLKIIRDYAIEHRETLMKKGKFEALWSYFTMSSQMALQNSQTGQAGSQSKPGEAQPAQAGGAPSSNVARPMQPMAQ